MDLWVNCLCLSHSSEIHHWGLTRQQGVHRSMREGISHCIVDVVYSGDELRDVVQVTRLIPGGSDDWGGS